MIALIGLVMTLAIAGRELWARLPKGSGRPMLDSFTMGMLVGAVLMLCAVWAYDAPDVPHSSPAVLHTHDRQ
ncbi:hypothetical protein [Bradyrhizobium sp. Cp5.3]|uniref:hypothetical protein n=1 Tax=Bradyrhizobium sp. Cp5.3 TaxID=443598 RepID=UPI0003FBB79A|nr:hypothetical protein [Bradyrhizobium sp. Cp5.3]